MQTPDPGLQAVGTLFCCKNKVAIVTGGAGLYGFAISEALCEAGATVIVASRDHRMFQAKLPTTTAGSRLHHRTLDLTRETSISELCKSVRGEFGRIDILVNNALTPMGRSLEGTTAEAWRRSMEGNILGLYLMCRHAAGAMQQNPGGSIINIASIYGTVAPDFQTYEETHSAPNPIEYGFLKGGMLMFTRTLASYLGKHQIRVNSIIPGGIHDETDSQDYILAYQRKVPLGRWALPQDIKGAVLYLASEASAYVTGTSLTVDGGYTAL